MDDNKQDPEKRAFSGHPDHPPRQADQPPKGNEELLRGGGASEGPEAEGEERPKASDDDWTNLPGYG